MGSLNYFGWEKNVRHWLFSARNRPSRNLKSSPRVTILSDETDSRTLECARTGRADLIVTGDRGMLSLGRYRDIEIKSLREYLAS